MFEGVSKDDANYHMLIYHKPAGQNASNANHSENAADGAQIGNADAHNQGDNSAGKQVNQLILIYPNGIVCIYDNILQNSSLNRRKVQLREVIQSDYENITAPQILQDRLIFVSQPNLDGGSASAQSQASRSQNSQAGLSPLLVSIDMSKFETEIALKPQTSCRDALIIRIVDHLLQNPQGSSSNNKALNTK